MIKHAWKTKVNENNKNCSLKNKKNLGEKDGDCFNNDEKFKKDSYFI